MPLPFFKSKTSNGSINVKATAVKQGIALPPAIVTRAAPDLGDYSIEHPEQLPAWGKSIPVIFWGILVVFALWFFYQQKSNEDFTVNAKRIQQSLNASETKLKQANEESERLAGKIKDLNVLGKWLSASETSREIISSCFQAASDRVQVRNLEFKRRDGVTSRYSLVLVCMGTRQSFDAMRVDLNARLSELGWTVSETTDQDESRLTFEANLSRKG